MTFLCFHFAFNYNIFQSNRGDCLFFIGHCSIKQNRYLTLRLRVCCYHFSYPPASKPSHTVTVRRFRSKTRAELLRISAAVMGIEFCYAAETAFVSPTLLSIGTDNYMPRRNGCFTMCECMCVCVSVCSSVLHELSQQPKSG